MATMAQLIMGAHVFSVPNDHGYFCPIGFSTRFAFSKEKVAFVGSDLKFGAKVQLENSCSFCLCLQLLFKVLLTLDGKIFCHTNAVAFLNLSNNVVCVWSMLNLTEKQIFTYEQETFFKLRFLKTGI